MIPRLWPAENDPTMFAKGKGEIMTNEETPQVIGVRRVGLSARPGRRR
jgi:hypothetical protein